MRPSYARLPISISALETKTHSHILGTLKDLAVEMFETLRRRPDHSGDFRTVADQSTPPYCRPPEDEYEEEDGEDAEWVGDNGEGFLIRPNRPGNARNAPGAAVAAARVSIHQFRGRPTDSLKGPARRARYSCGATSLPASGDTALNPAGRI